MTGAERRLPDGFVVRVRDDVARRDGGRVLVGGSPMRLIRLREPARRLLVDGRLVVCDGAGSVLATRLLDANLADPVLTGDGPTDVSVVIPIRDRPEQLDRCLEALRPLPCIVVDDASTDPRAVADVAARHGATLVALTRNVGPAGARNVGLGAVSTAYVAFVDSDVQVSGATLRRLARHFADPAVALVGPMVRSRATSVRPRWFERYDEHASSLALGRRACSVRPGAAVGWLPSACLVARVDRLGVGFTDEMRVGEDVDLVWRLVRAGEVVRYAPGEIAHHDARTTIRGWLGRKFVYGTGGGELGRRHGTAVAPAVIPPLPAIAAAAMLLGGRRTWPIAGICALVVWARIRRTLPAIPRRGALAAGLAGRGLGWAVRQEAALLMRHSWPAAVAVAVVSRPARRALVLAFLVEVGVQASEVRRVPLPSWILGRLLDNLAYGAGLWVGALRSRSAACLRPSIVRHDSPGATRERVRGAREPSP